MHTFYGHETLQLNTHAKTRLLHKIFWIFLQTQPKILAGAKLTFHMHEYFFSVDLDLRNLTKFSWHFSDFSMIFN